MGDAIGWVCKSCGAGESFTFGAGFGSFQNEDDLANVAAGVYGELASRIAASEGIAVVSHSVYYRCECGGFVPATALQIVLNQTLDGGSVWAFPETAMCPQCGGHLFVGGYPPVPESEIERQVQNLVESGCPNCGEKAVETTRLCWD